jgi:alpha-L-fucosidase 2
MNTSAIRIGLTAILILTGLQSVVGAESAAEVQLWYRQPALIWEEALPVGNGRIGAMVYGGVLREHIQLNEETIWSGAPTPTWADPAFRELRRRRQELLFQGKFRDTNALTLKFTREERAQLGLGEPERVNGTSSARHAYQPLADLFLHFDHGVAREQHYRRSLNLDTAVATTTYRVGDTQFTREVFASYPAQALVIRIRADQPGALNFAASLDYRRDVEADMYRYDAELGVKAASVSVPPRPVWSHLGTNRFSWTGRGHPDGVRFEAHFEVRNEGGTLVATDDGFRVSRADAVTVIMTVGTDYRGGQPAERAAKDLEALTGTDYAALRAAHVVDHQRLFQRVRLDLGRTRAADMPTDRRVLARMWARRILG